MESKLCEVDKLYELYELELLEKSENSRVYLYNSGYFSNIEIIYVTFNDEIDNLFEKYSAVGYSVRKKQFTTIEQLKNELFYGFFNISLAKQREKAEYTQYCKLLSKKMRSEYSYINSKYVLEGDIKDTPIVDYMLEQLGNDGPQMIILEASAGFGKTCTSYELYNQLALKDDNKIAILAELSKNRNATVFRYVLLSEINRSFTRLSAELVTSEIKNGNIILIIDGFDELLHVNSYISSDEKTSIENAQTMLDTISELFSDNSQAKIILTARKSSIFTGDIFDNWIEKRLSNCNVHRIQIEPPTITNWLGKEKCRLLNEKNISLSNITNPVLLSFLKNMDIDKIKHSFNNVDDMITCYFDVLLLREMDRQSLTLDVLEQQKIMYLLAIEMAEFNISEESSDIIKEILKEIIGDDIDIYLKRYDDLRFSSEEKPTDEQFYDRLTHHALLDRVSANKNLIGFVNNFIFGLFLGDALCKEELQSDKIDTKFIDYAATSYEVKSLKERELLLSKIKKSPNLKQDLLFYLDTKLVHQTQSNYNELVIEGIKFDENFVFNEKYTFKNCIFMECIFEGCHIPANIFKEVQFYNCRFFNIVVDGYLQEDDCVIFCGSDGFEAFFNNNDISKKTNDSSNDILPYEKPILEQFWKPGAESAELYRSYTTLFRGFSPSERKNIEKSINKLISEDILIKQIHCLKLNIRKLDIIKEIIGR